MQFGVGIAQPLSRFGASSHINIRGADATETDTAMEVANASPSKKKSGLLKGLKKISTLLSGSSSISSNLGVIRPDSDPSRNGLAHALSTPEMPAAIPVSMSASPSPSYMDMARGQRLGAVLRSGGTGSPPTELHSPCSPFPAAGRKLVHHMNSDRDISVHSCEDVSVKCHVHGCATQPVAVPSQQAAVGQPYSPIAVASPPTSTFSPYESGSSGSSRLENTCESSSPCTSSAYAAPSSGDCSAASRAGSATPPAGCQPPLLPATTLLALNPALPGAMRRRTWCLEDYQVVKRLYKGGSASVYKANCLRSGLPVALKVYFLTRVPRNVVHMIKREIELHHQLVHPNIVQLYAAFLDGDRIVLVQEYAARGDLFHLLRQMGGRMTEEQVSEVVMRQFLEGLAYLHSHGVCHRDIKPENILYNDQWVLKIADFGVSINLNDERAVTRAGTVDYMAPEVTRCPLKAEPQDNKDNASLAYTSAVDIWAAGVLAYELLVGFTPVLTSDPQTSAAQHRKQPAPDLGGFLASQATPKGLNFPASLSTAARDFILRSLSENAGDRPTAKELLKHPWMAGPQPGPAAAVAATATGARATGARQIYA